MSAPQQTHAWLMERVGFVTASRFKDVLNFRKDGKPGADRIKYLSEIVCERLTGQPTEHFVTKAMQFGTEQEPAAREAYCRKTGNGVTAVGFLKRATMKAGASPDGIVDMEYGIEIKVPNSTTHLETLLNGMSDDHLPQVQGAMWITGFEFWDFVSFDPRMPESLQLHVQRIQRDETFIKSLSDAVAAFSDEADQLIAKLMETSK
jgi:hypothetical protein